MFYSIFLFVFAFSLGVITTLVAGGGLIYYFLKLMEQKYTQHITAPKKPSEDGGKKIHMQDHSQRHVQGFIKCQTEEERFRALRTSQSSYLAVNPIKALPWSFGLIKGNMLFKFQDDKMESMAQVMCLDGCTIEVTDSNWASKNTAIVVVDEERDLLVKGCHRLYMYFVNGKELEEWYYGLIRASTISQNLEKIQIDDEKIHSYFSTHCQALLRNDENQSENNASWCNAMLARLWWQFQDNKSFQRFIRNGLAGRITKMTDFPSFIESMTLERVQIGSNLPTISNASLHSMTELGEVNVDMDVEYQAGLEMVITVQTSMQLPGTSIKVPASAHVKIKKLSGRMRLHVSPPPCERFWIGFLEEPTFDVDADTKIGAEAVMPSMVQMANNMLKKTDLANIIVNKFKANIITETMVLPNMDEWPLPYWPDDGEVEEEEGGLEFFRRPEVVEDVSSKRSSWYLKKGAILDFSADGISVLGSRIFSPQPAPTTTGEVPSATLTQRKSKDSKEKEKEN